MKREKIFIRSVTVLVIVVVLLCLNVFVQQKFIKTYTYTELENRGYTAQDVHEIQIIHSYLNRILSYNEWRISVEFEKESVLEYSERFKNGNLFE